MRRTISLLVFFSLFNILQGQQKVNFRSPMDIPLLLSGNFGELRTNHFHSGIDIKTQGVTGKKVHAIESGYVSRIKVQSGGYGKALYIHHPGGYTSVYGHLDDYAAPIRSYVKDQQYSRQMHTIDLYLNPGEIKVKKGDVIAFSGNTGSSSGPHLHFEVRRSGDQVPLNGLMFDFPVVDDIPPRLVQAAIYPLEEDAHVEKMNEPLYMKVNGDNGQYKISEGNPVSVGGKIGFGVEVYDYLNGAPNRCGIFTLELMIDSTRYFLSEMDAFSFSESRFINAHIDYAEKYNNNSNIQRLYKLPFNDLSIYKYLKDEGAVLINDTLVHHILIIATDTYGNSSSISFEVKGSGKKEDTQNTPEGILIPHDSHSKFSLDNIDLEFPAYCFYQDFYFRFSADTSKTAPLFSKIYNLHDGSVPVHGSFNISVTPYEFPVGHEEQLCLVSINEDGGFEYAGGRYTSGKVSADLRALGAYAISVDTVPPEIIPLDLYDRKNVSSQESINFRVSDNLSGIESYDGYINGQWVLFEYDPKNERLFYEFDNRIPFSKKIDELTIVLSDQMGNTTEYQTTFIR